MAKQRTPGLWIKVRLGDDGEIGPGKVELLRRIEAQESISAAPTLGRPCDGSTSARKLRVGAGGIAFFSSSIRLEA